MNRVFEVLSRLKVGHSASTPNIDSVELILGFSFPLDYREFLSTLNGAEGFVGSNYVTLWASETLVQMNREYAVQVYAPGFIMIGTNGSGEGFGFDNRDSRATVVALPLVGMDWREHTHLADTFSLFVQHLLDC